MAITGKSTEGSVLDNAALSTKRIPIPDRDPADNDGRVATAPIDNVPEDQRPKSKPVVAPKPTPKSTK